MTYGARLETFLGTTHRYAFDGDATDSVGTLDGALAGMALNRAAICRDLTNAVSSNGTGDRVTVPTSGTIDDAVTEKGVCGWAMFTDFQLPFCRLYGEGDNVNSISIVVGPGNSVTFEADNATFVAQVYADRSLQANRPYHFMWLWDDNGLRGYLDGVRQTLGDDFAQSSVTLTARNSIVYGDPTGNVSLGGTTVVLVSGVTCDYNEWHHFDPTGITDQEIFDRAFADGAIAGATVTSQAELDALADTLRPNEPVNIRVDVAGNIDLTADNITHDPLASCHVHYTGTGTLNWTNTNGSNASIGSSIDGTVNFINPATLTVNGLIDGCEIRIYEDDGVDQNDFGTELAGQETLSGTTFNYPHSGASNGIVVQMIADGYVEVIERFTLDSSDQTLTLFPDLEENL